MAPDDPRFSAFEKKMRGADLAPLVIDAFRLQYKRLAAGATGLIDRTMIEPVRDLATLDDIAAAADAGRAALAHTVVIKLNGGLGTSMGLERAKSLIEVREGMSFLDITARQIEVLAEREGVRVPLLLMNSFATRDDSLAAIARHHVSVDGLPPDFMQHMVPKVLCDSLLPAEWPAQPALEWCPPGHGDLYIALVTSGLLDLLESRGIRHAFVSNSDNLGATLDPAILGHIVTRNIPFLMEVTRRTEADRKGGHLARARGGGYMLRESAQCPPDEAAEFQDVSLYRYFNTNSLWIDLGALRRLLAREGGVPPLPLIRNAKTLDPRDPSSPRVFQLETAMGAAIALFDGAEALCVPRTRFAPVKTTEDLFVLWSDAYRLTGEARIELTTGDATPPAVTLDPRHFRLIDDLHARLPHGAPSMRACTRLAIHGDVIFGADVRIEGDVRIDLPDDQRLYIPDGTVLRNTILRDGIPADAPLCSDVLRGDVLKDALLGDAAPRQNVQGGAGHSDEESRPQR